MNDLINTKIRISEWLEKVWNKFFGKKPEIIQEKPFEELIAEKLDVIFNCNYEFAFRPLDFYERGFDTLVDMVIHKKFRYNRHKNFYSIEIYDAAEPELREVVYLLELNASNFVVNNRRHYHLTSKYTPGIWDESFLETLDELVDIKIAERKDVEEKRLKELEQEELNKKIAEEVKQERIRKMFEKNT